MQSSANDTVDMSLEQHDTGCLEWQWPVCPCGPQHTTLAEEPLCFILFLSHPCPGFPPLSNAEFLIVVFDREFASGWDGGGLGRRSVRE